jgi:hypothetical protein
VVVIGSSSFEEGLSLGAGHLTKVNLGSSGNPVWSPDSQRLVYFEWTNGSYEEAPVKQLPWRMER